MSHHIEDFFSKTPGNAHQSRFHKVIPLHEQEDLVWEVVQLDAKTLPKGWFELSQLSNRDRIDFTHEFWSAKMPYHPKLEEGLAQFFNSIDQIGVFLIQQKYDDPLEAIIVYELKNNRGYFQGAPPASTDDIVTIQDAFPRIIFPEDYIAFLEIHNGFRKASDSTGVIATHDLKVVFDRFQELIKEHQSPPTTAEGEAIDPKTLVPFYESFGMPFFQCFWADWHPEQEMGNVYYSGVSHTISDLEDVIPGSESMAFSSFAEWLLFYLEQIEI